MSAQSAPLPLGPSAANDGAALLADRYRLDTLLGKGGMGEVWAATDVELDREVAIKLMLPRLARDAAFSARFRTETLTAARLSHRNIPRIFTTATASDGRLYMVMERVPGVSLRWLLDRKGKLEPTAVVCFAIGFADALGCAHGVGIFHRDIKPENLMVNEDDGRAWLLDFGIAKLLLDGAARRPAAAGGGKPKSTQLGTIGYLPPELVRGEPVDHRGDFYSLGVSLYEAVAGRRPYAVEATDKTGMWAAHAYQDPRPIKDCPPRLWAILLRLLAKEPSDRYGSADELLAALRAYFEEPAPSSHPMAPFLAHDRLEQASRAAFASVAPAAETLVEETAEETPAHTEDEGHDVMPSGQGGTAPLGPVSRTQPLARAAAGAGGVGIEEGVRMTIPVAPGTQAVSPAHPAALARARHEAGAPRPRPTVRVALGARVESPAHPAARAARAAASPRAEAGALGVERWVGVVLLALAVGAVGTLLVLAVGVGAGAWLARREAAATASPAMVPSASAAATASPATATATPDVAPSATPSAPAAPSATVSAPAAPSASAAPEAARPPRRRAPPIASGAAAHPAAPRKRGIFFRSEGNPAQEHVR